MKTTLSLNGVIGYFKEFWAFGGIPSSGSLNLDLNNGNWQKVSIVSNLTLTLINGKSGTTYLVRVEQGSAGPYPVMFTNVEWGDVGAPNHLLDKIEGDWMLISVYFDGTKYYGSWGNEYLNPWFP